MRRKEQTRINELIWLIGESPKSVTELKKLTGMALGSLSYHLKYLRDKGIVKTEKIKVNTKGGKKIYKLKKYKEIMRGEIESAVKKIILGIEGIKSQLENKTISQQEYNKFKSDILESLE